ncbi:MAG TPA: hypothetical protein VKR52_16320 [Terracidiphilus sp.]|nr:hypothetical protein [Terracidiphilus sp.]
MRAKLHRQQFSNSFDGWIFVEDLSHLADASTIRALSDQQSACSSARQQSDRRKKNPDQNRCQWIKVRIS